MSRTLVLILLVLAQFACVSLWFAANAVMADLVATYHIHTSIGTLTSMVQFGFIAGTLVFAVLSISDRNSPSLVFLICSILGAIANAGLLITHDHLLAIYGLRFLTGFFLAGIYPTGMKIAADYYDKDISKALGWLLGALVIGTAFPLLLRSGIFHLPWKIAIVTTSSLAVVGGMMIGFLVPDGPFRKSNPGFKPQVILSIFRHPPLRKAVIGYFGHMWELYAFWAFVPTAVLYFAKNNLLDFSQGKVMTFSFLIIAVGSIACMVGGYWAIKISSRKVALFALISSGVCCLLSPILLQSNLFVVIPFLLFWGMTVIMDSPQFSSMVSGYAPVENRGTALTIVNCIGFTISIISIQLLDFLSVWMETRWIFLFLFPGPLLGVMSLLSIRSEKGEVIKSIP
jgi:MFS family permease